MDRVERTLFYLFILLIPTQFGKHFWPDFTIVSGIRIDYLSPIIYVTDVILILLIGSFIFRWCRALNKSKVKSQKSKVLVKNKKFLFILGLLVFFSINILFASRPQLSLYGFVKLCEYAFLTCYLARTMHSQLQLQQMSLLFALSAIFESSLAILQYLNQGSLNGIFYFFGERTFTGATPGIANASINGTLILRPYATFPHPNVLAAYLLISMVFIWSFLLRSKQQWMKIIAALSLLVSSIALLLTYSRVVILLWIGLAIMQFFRQGLIKIKTKKGIIASLGIVLVSLFLLSFVPIIHELYFRFMQTSLSDESVVERTKLLSASWIMIQQHLLIGVGLLNFIPSLAPLQKPLPLNLYLQPVHNIFVLVAVETGFMGCGLFIWLLTATLLRIKKFHFVKALPDKQEVRIRGTLFVLILIILITGMFDHYWLTLQQGQLLFTMVIGLSWATIVE